MNTDKLPFVALDCTRTLPACSAVYFVRDGDGNILYIGRTVNLLKRWKNHVKKKQILAAHHAPVIAWLEVPREQLKLTEGRFIRELRPALNQQGGNTDYLPSLPLAVVNGMEIMTCRICGYKWQPRTSNPVKCPECQRRWPLKKDRKL